MIPTSDDLEAFQDRVTCMHSDLGAHRNFVRVDQSDDLATLARDWLRLSSALKEGAEGFLPSLDEFDAIMTEILKATKQRSRANTFRRHLGGFKNSFMDAVVVPVMRHEGSPAQAAARQLEESFRGLVSAEESQYIAEAARCSSVKCQRAVIVMLWAAAIARFHSQIQVVGFAAFNEAAAISAKKKGHPFNRISGSINVTSLADLQLGRDFDIIAVGIQLWGYDMQTFDELNRCLNIRNSAAHPGSFEPGSLDVRQFAEKLRHYVFSLVGKKPGPDQR